MTNLLVSTLKSACLPMTIQTWREEQRKLILSPSDNSILPMQCGTYLRLDTSAIFDNHNVCHFALRGRFALALGAIIGFRMTKKYKINDIK